MPADRDIAAFDARAESYERGWLGRLHHEIVGRTADLALSERACPLRVLDIGCGTGQLLRSLGRRCPETVLLAGLDPAPSMVGAARSSAGDHRLVFSVGVAEHLPHPSATFDLVVSTTSFDHWSSQLAGLRECARVLVPGGRLLLVDQFSLLLTPTLVAGRRAKARTRRRCDQLLATAGFRSPDWHRVYAVLINAVTATTGVDA